MARWRVISPHYIYAEQYGQPTEWAREETNRESGRTFRKTMKVPLLVDPNDPSCLNRQGMCVVASKGSEQPGDIVMEGLPTPDLEPLDDEAEAISAEHRHKWVSPIDSLPLTDGESLAAQLIRAFESQISIAQTVQPASLKGVGSTEIAELKAMILAQQAQISELVGVKQPVNTEPPLEDIDPDAPAKSPPAAVVQPRPAPSIRRRA